MLKRFQFGQGLVIFQCTQHTGMGIQIISIAKDK